ncbi:MAG TPA: lipopolysaccharide kinase InaA family protein [candidate division Zixibacteria bacterium]|nr:lipopolysaccharide kinase InaA family protein [candidate division Zixibacteria bacterium]
MELEYEDLRDGAWRLRVLRGRWNERLRGEVAGALSAAGAVGRHPATVRLRLAEVGDCFLKIFGRESALKSVFRVSKALRALDQGAALAQKGLNAPVAVAAGEERRFGAVRRAFLLTRAVPGETLPAFLLRRHGEPADRAWILEKRKLIRELAAEVRKLHDLGFVHGDLVAANVMIARADGVWRFYFIDNDRTRRYPRRLPQSLWKRNLVQLNRLVLPGISLQDRLRFFRAYVGREALGGGDLRLLRWLEAKTRKRRRDCDHVSPEGSFRTLMKWSGRVAGGS